MKTSLIKPIRIALAFGFLAQSALAQNLEFTANGRDGKDSKNGYSYSGHAERMGDDGMKGRDGGHATEATPGTNAGQVVMNAELQREQGIIMMTGRIEHEKKTHNVDQQVFYVDQAAAIRLQATGGKGGDGGIGGDAEGGGHGRDGSNATVDQEAERGGNAGRGGDAGRGTSGKKSGAGGVVEIKMKAQDTALLMAVEIDVRAGKPGEKGRHGKAGDAGTPGSGGNGGTWDVYTHSTYSKNPDGSDKETKHYRKVTRSSAPNGMSNVPGTERSEVLHDGEKAKDGVQRIIVTDVDGKENVYETRYDLRLMDFDVVESRKNGTLEPTEKIFVRKLKIKNTGGMPSPAFSKTHFTLKNGEYFVSTGQELVLEKSLQPGEEYVFDGELAFEIKDNHFPVGEERWQAKDTIRHESLIPDVRRGFENFDNPREITITYPIEIEPIEAPRSLAPGEKGRLLLRVKNLSTQALGVDSEGKRQIEIQMDHDRDYAKSTGQQEALLMMSFGKNVLEFRESVAEKILALEPGGTAILQGEISIAPDAAPFSASLFHTNLNLDERAIQSRNLEVRVSQTYVYNREEILLVVNSTTPKAVTDKFVEAARQMGQRVAIWDISYYSGVALQKALNNGSTLAKDFRGGTIVLLSDYYKSTLSVEQQASELLRTRDLLASIAEHGTNFMIVGENVDGGLLGKHLLPMDGQVKQSFRSVSEYIAALKKNQSPSDQARANGEDYSKAYGRIEVENNFIFGKGSQKQIDRLGNRLIERLKRQFPERSFSVVTEFAPQQAATGIFGTGFAKRWKVGSLEIRESLDPFQGKAFALKTPTGALTGNAPWSQTELYSGLLMSQSMEKKISAFANTAERIHAAGGGDTKSLEQLLMLTVDMMVADIAAEQLVFRDVRWDTMKSHDLFARMRSAQVLLRSSLLKVKPETSPVVAQQLARLVAEVEMISNRNIDYLGFFLPVRRATRVNRSLDIMGEALRESIFGFKKRMGVWTQSTQGLKKSVIENMIKAQKEALRTAINTNAPKITGTEYSQVKADPSKAERLLRPSTKAVSTEKAAEVATAQKARDEAIDIKQRKEELSRSHLTGTVQPIQDTVILTCDGVF